MEKSQDQITKEQARALLRSAGLRATVPRVAVLQLLAKTTQPLSHTEVVQQLLDGDWDPATIYRNLVKLREAGIALVVSRVDGVDRYVFSTSDKDAHRHAHFSCEYCGIVECLPDYITSAISLEGRWARSIEQAMIQIRGVCPDCLAS